MILLALLCVFYGIYFVKMVLLRKQGIAADLLGKGDKPKGAVLVERVLKAITYLGAAAQFVSVLYPNLIWSIAAPLPFQIIGIALAAAGVVFFLLSVTIMRGNWRAGFDEKQDTALVTGGVYRFSRNPAFVGFGLLYIGCSLSVPSAVILIVTVTVITAFHIQILGEEKFLAKKFGQEYIEYKGSVRRYF